jgi:putative DNA primase/helicase
MPGTSPSFNGTNGIQHAIAGLAPEHLADLRKSDLSDEQIVAAGLYTETDPGAVRVTLGWQRSAACLGPCLVIPFRNADGSPSDYSRIKPLHPRKSKAKPGKPPKLIKYESPVGRPNRAYFPPGVWELLNDPSVPLLLTEGEKKALKAMQDGFPCVGLTGVWSWQVARSEAEKKANAPRALIPDLDGIVWEGRVVYPIFDSDALTNPLVRSAEWHLAKVLENRGATVLVVRLPPGPGGAKVGLDDFLVAHGPEALQELIDEAEPPKRPAAPPAEKLNDPHRLARVFQAAGALRLHYWRQEFYEWTGASYRAASAHEVRARVAAAVKAEFDRLNARAVAKWEESGCEDDVPLAMSVSCRLVADVIQALAGYCLLPGAVAPPSWVGVDGPVPAAEVLSCRNGLLHLPSFVAGSPNHLLVPTPHYFTLNSLDYDFDPHAPLPVCWLDFLDRLWPDDAEAISTLQEWFGYLLTADTRQQKILLIVGPRRGGKGTIGRVLRRLVGEANVAGPTLGSLGTNFGLWPLLDKSVAIVSDARLSGRTDTAVITERLLSISGEDALTVDRKNLQPVTTKLPTRFVILTNELPRLSDASGALAGRFNILPMRRSWYGQEDHGLTDKLLAELPGIFLWAVEGWRRLRDRGRFEQPRSALQLVTSLEDLGSPIGAFVRECCDVGPGYEVEVQELFARWRWWCEGKGHKEHGVEQTFGRDLRAIAPGIDDRQPRRDGRRVRVYTGIRIKPGDQDEGG